MSERGSEKELPDRDENVENHSVSTHYDDAKLVEMSNIKKLRVSYSILTGQFLLVTILFVIEAYTS